MTFDLVEALERRYRLPAAAAGRRAARLARPQAMAGRIAARARRPLTRDWAAFAEAGIGGRFAGETLDAPALPRVYRLMGRAARNAFYRRYLRLALSLSVNVLAQSLQATLLLGPQLLERASMLERALAFEPARGAATEPPWRERAELLRIVERGAAAFELSSGQSRPLLRPPVQGGAGAAAAGRAAAATHVTAVLASARGAASGERAASAAVTRAVEQAWQVLVQRVGLPGVAGAGGPAAAPHLNMSFFTLRTGEPAGLPRPLVRGGRPLPARALRSAANAGPGWLPPAATRTLVLSALALAREGRAAGAATLAEAAGTARMPAAEARVWNVYRLARAAFAAERFEAGIEAARQLPPAPVWRLPGERRTPKNGGAAVGPALNRELVVAALGRAGEGEEPRPEAGAPARLTFVQAAQQMQPPGLGYVYEQPPRAAAAEDQVIRRVEEREVVEIVHKEVQTIMASSPPLSRFSRADYEQIADNVFGNLARRMIVERERLGWRT